MKLKLTTILLISFLIAFITITKANPEIKVNAALLSALKNGVTYVPINRPESDAGKKYMQIIQENWKISKIQFISYSDIPTLLQKDKFFLSFSLYESGFRSSSASITRPADDYSVFSLNLWTCSEEYFKKQPKKVSFKDPSFDERYRTSLAKVLLAPDFHLWANHDDLYNLDYSGNGHIEGLGEGVFKNFLQSIQMSLQQEGAANSLAPAALKKITITSLYIPRCVLEKNALNNWGHKVSEDKVFKHFKPKYQFLSTEELNQKIINGEDFYYLLFIKGKVTHTMIFHSSTGQQVYYKKRDAFLKVHFDDKDTESLNKALIRK